MSLRNDDGIVRIRGMRDWVDMWIALRQYLGDARGTDQIGGWKTPRTTNDDVLQLVPIWDHGAATAREDVFGVRGAKARWAEVADQVEALTEGAHPLDLYPENLAFWRVSNQLAVRIQVAAEEPPDVDFVDALADNVRKLPGRIVDAGSWLAGGAGDAVTGAADTAGDAVGGLLSRGLGPVFKPLMIGAGLLGGGYLLIKASQQRRARRVG